MKPTTLIGTFIAMFMAIIPINSHAALTDHFVTTWQTDNPGTSNDTSITVPMVGGPYDVDWNNDGTFDQFGISGSVTHDYGDVGTHTIRIRGIYDSIRFINGGDKEKIISLDQWGTNQWTTMIWAFFNASNLEIPATDRPNFSSVTSMYAMFHGATAANPDTSGWDTSAVTDMSHMFWDAISANPDTSEWDVTSLIDATDMLKGATLSLANYESLLVEWNAQILQPSVTFSGGYSVYCSALAVAARANLIASNKWIITDGGQHCPPVTPGIAPDMTPETDTGPLDNDDITSDSTPAFYVDCSTKGNTITLYSDNPVINTKVGEHICKATGIEKATVTTALLVSVHNITYTDRIGGAESGHSPALSITTIGPLPTDHFVTNWKTDNPGTSNDTSITVPMVGGPYDVDWDNDGDFDEFGLYGSVTHDFEYVDTYTIRVVGGFSTISFRHMNDRDRNDREKIISLDQWGTHSWSSMASAFHGTSNLTITATDTPDFSATRSMNAMFWGPNSVDPDTSDWDTSAVTDMSGMFSGATAANPDTSGWDTSSVTSMDGMFYNATAANPDTSGWDTSAVTDMKYMFYGATAANPHTSGWDTSSVISMDAMFFGATSFDQDIGSWNISSLTDATDMFTGTTLSPANYDSLLIGWNKQSLKPGVTFSGGNSQYCSDAAKAARATMIASDGWVITDGGQSLTCPPDTCNFTLVMDDIEYFDATHEACEILVLGPDFIAADGSNITANSGWEIEFLPGFLIEQGATINANVCGQSLCMTSDTPMPLGCHSCVDLICATEPACCELAFDQACLDKVDTVCGLVCE